MSEFDLSQFQLSPSAITELAKARKARTTQRWKPTAQRGGAFIKGPIPLRWAATAARLSPSKAAATGVAIWYLAGLRKSNTFILPNGLLGNFGVGPQAKYRCLKALEDAGLITVEYRIRTTNELFNVVFPLYLEEGVS